MGITTKQAKYWKMIRGNERTKKLINLVFLHIHPLLFSTYPILFLYANSKSYFPISVVIKPLIIIWVAVLLLILVFWLFFKRFQKVTIFASLFLFGFFSYGHILSLSQFLLKPAIGYIPRGFKYETLILISWFFLMLTAAFWILKRSSLDKVGKLFTRISFLLVMFTLVNIGGSGLNQKKDDSVYGTQIVDKNEEGGNIVDSNDFPNIYYIILDGYGRSDVLRNIYDYDNSDFLENLIEKGFYVAAKSRTNYIHTPLSLSSSLNFDYIDNLLRVDENYNKFLPLYELIHNNKAASLLKSYGYKFVVISSGYYGTEIRSADTYISANHSLGQFESGVLDTTPIPLLLTLANVSTKIDTTNIHRNRILKALDNLKSVFLDENPMFVFAHIEAPHPPFVFGPNGEPVNYLSTAGDLDGPQLIFEKGLGKEKYQKLHKRQATYISRKTIEMVDSILEKSRESIIVIQGDHGPRSLLDWENLSDDGAKESFSILNLYYFPNGGYDELYEDITPVNSFRVIFNKFFSTDYELLEDRSYFSNQEQPYKFFDVTDRIR